MCLTQTCPVTKEQRQGLHPRVSDSRGYVVFPTLIVVTAFAEEVALEMDLRRLPEKIAHPPEIALMDRQRLIFSEKHPFIF